jgi:hypothetical protein
MLPLNEAAIAPPVGFENQTVEAEVKSEIHKVKCKPGQGKLNRLIAKAQQVLSDLDHGERRFKRNYEDGTASYTCPHCGATVFVGISTGVYLGNAIETKCTRGHSRG